MAAVKIPDGYNRLMPYLILEGAGDFLSFCKTVFDAQERMKHMRDEHLIMHAEVSIGESVIMCADSTEDYPPITAGLFIYVNNADEVFSRALEAGAETVMPPADQEYGRSCGVKDPFGNVWWVTSL